MANMVPALAQQILDRTFDYLRLRANSNGECFGGEIMDGRREAGLSLGADRPEVLLTRTILVRTMESLGEPYPADVLQNYDHRMPLSKALKYLRESIDWTRRLKESAGALSKSISSVASHAPGELSSK